MQDSTPDISCVAMHCSVKVLSINWLNMPFFGEMNIVGLVWFFDLALILSLSLFSYLPMGVYSWSAHTLGLDHMFRSPLISSPSLTVLKLECRVLDVSNKSCISCTARETPRINIFASIVPQIASGEIRPTSNIISFRNSFVILSSTLALRPRVELG